MTKKSVISLPNGTVLELSPDLSPEQITAMITACSLTSQPSFSPSSPEKQSGETFIHNRTIEEIWNESKKERVALFIRTFMSESLWFNAKDIQDQQITVTGKLALGETSAIGTYLNRLYESGHLNRQKRGTRNVYYQISEKIAIEYPVVETKQFDILIKTIH